MEPKHLILAIFTMFCFGSAYPLGKLGTNEIPPILFSSLRVLIIFFGILPFFKFQLPQKKSILTLIIFSLSMGIGVYVSLYLALDITSLVSPIIIGTQLTVPFGLILSFFVLKEAVSIKKWILVAFAFGGIIIVAYDPRFGDEWIAILIISFMAFFYALSNMLSRSMKDIDTIDQMGWHSLISCLPLFILSFIFEGNPIKILFPISFSTILIILHSAIIVTLIGHGIIFYLYKFYPVATVLPFYSLFPIFGIFLSSVIFSELPNIYEYIGGIIVIGSVYLIHLENKKNVIKKN